MSSTFKRTASDFVVLVRREMWSIMAEAGGVGAYIVGPQHRQHRRARSLKWAPVRYTEP